MGVCRRNQYPINRCRVICYFSIVNSNQYIPGLTVVRVILPARVKKFLTSFLWLLFVNGAQFLLHLLLIDSYKHPISKEMNKRCEVLMYFGVQNIHVNMNRFAVLIDENSLHVIFSDIAVNLGAALRHLRRTT